MLAVEYCNLYILLREKSNKMAIENDKICRDDILFLGPIHICPPMGVTENEDPDEMTCRVFTN